METEGDQARLQVNDALVVPSDQDAAWPLTGLALSAQRACSRVRVEL